MGRKRDQPQTWKTQSSGSGEISLSRGRRGALWGGRGCQPQLQVAQDRGGAGGWSASTPGGIGLRRGAVSPSCRWHGDGSRGQPQAREEWGGQLGQALQSEGGAPASPWPSCFYFKKYGHLGAWVCVSTSLLLAGAGKRTTSFSSLFSSSPLVAACVTAPD